MERLQNHRLGCPIESQSAISDTQAEFTIPVETFRWNVSKIIGWVTQSCHNPTFHITT
ncbi:MAG: hypothetical protein LH702_06900 [Phormidesmis sp. CAN_BIN44]|nr:hypothetical protein [Phormidesmis sp. CAN_BIN44]